MEKINSVDIDIFKHVETQIQLVSSFQELVSIPFAGDINALCWSRELVGDFAEIANKIEFNENMVQLDEEELMELELSLDGQLAREILLNDLVLKIAYLRNTKTYKIL